MDWLTPSRSSPRGPRPWRPGPAPGSGRSVESGGSGGGSLEAGEPSGAGAGDVTGGRRHPGAGSGTYRSMPPSGSIRHRHLLAQRLQLAPPSSERRSPAIKARKAWSRTRLLSLGSRHTRAESRADRSRRAVACPWRSLAMASCRLRLQLLGIVVELLHSLVDLPHPPFVLHLALLVIGIGTPVGRRDQVACCMTQLSQTQSPARQQCGGCPIAGTPSGHPASRGGQGVNQLVSPLDLPDYLRLRWPSTGVLCCHCQTEAHRSGRIRQIRQLA